MVEGTAEHPDVDAPRAHAFVAAFDAAWRSSGVEAFLAAFEPLMHPEVRLEQPMVRTTVGYDAFRDEFRRVFYLMPDLRGEVTRWCARGNDLFVELTLRATLGGSPIAWRLCDRIELVGARCVERESYFDPMPIVGRVLSRPSTWLRWWRSGVGPPRRRFGGR